MLDLIDLTCPLLRSTFADTMLTFAGYFGRGVPVAVIGLAILGHGYFYKNRQSIRIGIAVFGVAVAAAGAAEIVKYLEHLAQGTSQTNYGIPSGQTSVAFGLASVLGASTPGLSPIFFGLATIAGISRLYLKSQSIWNVTGGALIGLACGLTVAKTLIPRRHIVPNLMRLATWFGIMVIGFVSLMFFYFLEKESRAHRVSATELAATLRAPMIFDFGAPGARASLSYGWSYDERWNGGKRSVVWATGLASEIVMNLPLEKDYQFRFHVFPNARRGPVCQRVEVRVNGLVVAKVLLERDWHWYQFEVPKNAVRAGRNFIQFYYDYAETPKSRARSSDERLLSVAFDLLQAWPKI